MKSQTAVPSSAGVYAGATGTFGVTEATVSGKLSAHDVHMNFSGVKALNGVDFTLAAGECVGVLGPNGSGKTTFVNCLSGVLTPTAGRVDFDGRDITRSPRDTRARHGLIRTFQNLRLFNRLSVAENVRIGLSSIARLSSGAASEQVVAAIEAQDLVSVAGERVGELPYGVQRRVEIARALISRPRVLLLDEPGAGLGHDECDILARALTRAREDFNCSILIIDHNVPLVAALSDRMILLADGKIVRDASPSVLLSDPTVADIYLGRSSHV